MATVAITGMAGFIGSHIAEAALARGFQVRGLDVNDRAPAGVERVVGDVGEAAAAARLCSGADSVVDTAAIVGEGGRKELFWRINVEVTRVVARTALSRVREARTVRRRSRANGWRAPSREPGTLDVVALRLGDVYGPGSVPWVVRPLELMRRRLFILPSGGRGVLNPVHIDDVMRAVFLALDRPVSGSFNITGGAAVTCREYFDRLAALAPLLGRKPIAYPSGVDFLMRPYAYSIEKARRDLDTSRRWDSTKAYVG